ncbi:MAG: class 1 fructose-bisphosphatase [Phycicoccus sp.]|nr:class 1 fructose-bisphosphatase [Phycicoccus sp.]
MLTNRTTLTQYLIEERRAHPSSTGDFNGLILDVALACRTISLLVRQGALAGVQGASGEVNVQGEEQKVLDVLANDAFLRATEWGGHVAGLVSEELDEPYAVPAPFPCGKYLLVFDPLDGSSNSDVNVTVGSLFSILRAPRAGEAAEPGDFLQPGSQQVAAGYAVYGPATMLVLTVGRGVHGFTLDPALGEFFLTHPDLRVPRECEEFAINASNSRFWEPAVQRYVQECLAGTSGPRGKDFNMRWVASMVADVHRILTRGGVYLYPWDTKDPDRAGRLRLLYEGSPVAMIMEQAGGLATTGRTRVLDVEPTDIHQRVPLIFGSAAEIERIETYHAQQPAAFDADPASGGEAAFPVLDLPLYGTRSLFRSHH